MYGAAFANITSGALAPGTMERVRRLGLTPRAQRLNALWSRYTATCYDARAIDWDGTKHVSEFEREALGTQGFVPPGYLDAGGEMSSISVKFRRPSTPWHLGRVIVNRFTGLLFSERRHPKIRCPGDPDTEDYATALADAARLWAKMSLARAFGGATGTFCLSFKFVGGKPRVEIHDPRWTECEFSDPEEFRVRRLVKRYQYPVEVEVEPGRWEDVAHWYRRVIDEDADTIWPPVEVGGEDADEPNWDGILSVGGVPKLGGGLVPVTRVEHGFGFAPVVWGQNMPVDDSPDGEPDCAGAFDLFDAIDALLSMANQGVTANSDPTVVIKADAEGMPQMLRKGSNWSVKLPANGSFGYAEISGTGPRSAVDLVDKLRAAALEVAQCVIEHPDQAGSKRTATEIHRTYASMTARADMLREQYGQMAVLPLLEMMLAAARKLGAASVQGGQIVRRAVVLPPRLDERGQLQERRLGSGAPLQLQWPDYFDPSLDDALSAAQAASAAKEAGLVDQEHASRFVAEHFGVEDVPGMVAKITQEKQAEQEGVQSALMSAQLRPGGG
jgi:hypothetical protein